MYEIASVLQLDRTRLIRRAQRAERLERCRLRQACQLLAIGRLPGKRDLITITAEDILRGAWSVADRRR